MRYKGYWIHECERADWRDHGGRWMVQTYHESGMPWSDQDNPHYRTLAEAKDSILTEIAWSRLVDRARAAKAP